MSFLISSSGSTTRHVLHQYGALSRTYSIPVRPSVRSIANIISARFNSRSTRPAAKSARPASSSERPILQRGAKVTKVGDESARKAWPSSNSMRTAGQPSVAYVPKKPAVQPAKPPHLTKPFDSTRSVDDAQRRQERNPGNEHPHEDKESATHLWSTTKQRIPLLWHGIWSLLAVAGVYGTLAYLDVKAGIPSSDGSQLPERATLSQSWYLTPTVISEGIKATWNALDDIAIIFIIVNTAMWLPPVRRLLGRSGLRGLRPFQVSRHSWSYGAKQAAYENVLLVLFLPGVIHYFDGDVFHFAAFAHSVQLITACLGIFALRYKSIPVENLSIAPCNIISAIIGVYCVTYATERIWVPPALIFRLEPWSILLAHVFYCGLNMARGPMLARIAYLEILLSTLLGGAYTLFNMKHHLWIPLVSEISSTQD